MAGTLVVGFVFVDIKGFALADYVPKGRNLGNIRFIHGGVSRNVAENIANCGMPVMFASLSEDTAIGRDVVRRLQSAGVDVTYMRPVEENGIGTWMVILDENGDVAGQISCPPDRVALETLVMERGEEMIRQCDNIILEIDTSPIIDETVLALAKKYHKPVYTVVGNMSIILLRRDFLADLDCFVCNEIEAGRLFECDLTDAVPCEMYEFISKHAPSIGCRSMVVTMGERGAVYYDTEQEKGGIVSAIPTALVDSTGAGDAFLSGLVMGLSRGHTLEQSVRIGTMLASKTIATTESCAPPDHSFLCSF